MEGFQVGAEVNDLINLQHETLRKNKGLEVKTSKFNTQSRPLSRGGGGRVESVCWKENEDSYRMRF